MTQNEVTTLTGLAVAIIALARSIALTNPSLTVDLRASLASAEASGVSSNDLELLRTIIKSVSLTPARTRTPSSP